ncbi:3-epi-6-deoxocathasterone 23-monooxygenase CYP90D1-like [Castanea sativa]|uniref:3-epi-6-deoxocathasterone 23-monooxygenase CYP90D1-like n=1 Tax=Castanea sativa TaxID=21020 RepID=UPI003F65213E
MKGQVLTNLVVEFTKELEQPDSEEVEIFEKGIMINTISSQQTWELFVDRVANKKGSGIRIMIISLEQITLEKSLRLDFLAINNEAEYEALQAGLNVVKKLGGKSMKVHCDLRLVAGQVQGEFEAEDLRMEWYLNQVKHPSRGEYHTNGPYLDGPNSLVSQGGTLPNDKTKAEKARRNAPRYWLLEEQKLYERSYLGPYLLCVHLEAVETLLEELPLGTLGLPFIGETIEFVSCAYSDRSESFMDKRRSMYGKVFKSHIFGSPTIVSTDAEVSKFILQSDAKAFVPSYPKSLTELMGKSSILVINGSLQKRIHGLIGAFFKSPHLKAQITRDMQKYVQESMANWKDDHPIYMQDETKNIAFQVLVKALISLDPGEEMEFLKKQFQEFISGLMSLPVNIPGTRLYRSLQAKKKMVKLVQNVILARKHSGFSNVPKDVVDVLLNDSSEQLTEDLIADNMIDMMIPGEDSVPVLMTLAIKYLSDCPTALQQLTEENLKLKELKAQLGQPLSWSDYLSLSFTQSVITETLRMGNIIIGVMRKAMRDIEIKGYLIPKGWCVFAYFRSVHLGANHYD